MKFSKNDIETIRDMTLRKYLDKPIDNKDPDFYLAKIYIESVMTFLKTNGYEIIKIEVSNITSEEEIDFDKDQTRYIKKDLVDKYSRK